MGTFLFIILLIVSFTVMGVFFIDIKHELNPVAVENVKEKNNNIAQKKTDSQKEKSKFKLPEYDSKYYRIAQFISVFMLSLVIEDVFNLVNLGIYEGTYALLGTSCFLMFMLSLGVKKRHSKFFVFASKLILVVTVLELTIFNAPTYRLWFGDYKEKIFPASEIKIEAGGYYDESEDCIIVTEGQELVLTFDGFESEIGNIKADVELGGASRFAKYIIDVKDESQTHDYRFNIAESRISRKRDCSHFIECYFSGKVSQFRVKITPQNFGNAYIKSVTCNTTRPFEVSWMRYVFLVLAGCLVFAVMNTSLLQSKVTDSKKIVNRATLVITISVCIIASVVTFLRNPIDEWKEQFKWERGNQLTQEIPDAFSKGQVNLLLEPSDELKEFDNPYDRQYRESEGIGVEWDHVYYNGKYYSYYGIAPAVLLFMPYYKLVGYYCPDAPSILLFAIIGIIGLSFMYRSTIRKFFGDIPVGLYIVSLIMIQAVSGIWFSLGRPWFYEIAIASGFAFITWASYFLISANILGGGKISLPRVSIASLLFSGAVLSRPTLVLYCICAAVFMICAVAKIDGTKETIKASRIRYLVCAMLPMVCIGCIQMWYNYARFDNPFEFGIQYSLTINNFTKSQFHPRLSLIAIFNYLFNPPIFSPEYPIISTKPYLLNTGAYFYYDYDSSYNTSGIFFLALPLFAYLLSGKVIRQLPDRFTRFKCASIISVPCLIIPFMIIASVWESGYAVRYMADFSWQMIIGAMAIIFFIYIKTENEFLRRLIRSFLCFSMIWAVIVGGVQGYNQAFRFADNHYDYPEMAYTLENAFLFWK